MSLALSLFSKRPALVLAILSCNSLFHLILDGLQIKWANGVNLLAPVVWEVKNFGLVWPESFLIYLLTGLGLGYALYVIFQKSRIKIDLVLNIAWQRLLGVLLLVVYFLLPLYYMQDIEAADSHYVHTLRDEDNRNGKEVEFDRNVFTKGESGNTIQTFAGEEIVLVGDMAGSEGAVSLKGRFVDGNTIEVHDVHYHKVLLRDIPSYIGLVLLVVLWFKEGLTHRYIRQYVVKISGTWVR